MESETSSQGRWVLGASQEGISSLRYEAMATAEAGQLGPEDVLVEIRAASLNYRDIAISKGNPSSALPLPATPNVIPGSDGAGVVVAVGSNVSPWLSPGVQVVAHMVGHIKDDIMPGFNDIGAGLGQSLNGTLCRRGIFHHTCLVPMPRNLTFEEAATLTCSGLTAWNALMGLRGKEVKEGDWVLIQGTGGVSIAALQIATAVGANIIAITSSEARAEKLRSLGAQHVINYKTETNWGEVAKSLTPGQQGVDHVVDVVGSKTLPQSLAAIRIDGLISIAGVLGGTQDQQDSGIMNVLGRICIVRGIILGSRSMFRDMVQFIEQKGLRPAIDDVIFSIEDAKKAFERLERWEHFSKVMIKM